jgi:hypothetical protein
MTFSTADLSTLEPGTLLREAPGEYGADLARESVEAFGASACR